MECREVAIAPLAIPGLWAASIMPWAEVDMMEGWTPLLAIDAWGF